MTVPPLSPNAWLRWELVSRGLRRERAGSVLEIGPGRGALACRLSQDRRYVGVEHDELCRTEAQAILSAAGTVVADLAEVGDERFEVVCAFEVLEHIEDDAGALAAWADRVQPGGRLFVSVPAHQARYGPCDELAGHRRRYSRAELESRLRGAGLVDVRIDAVGFPLAIVLEWGRDLMAARHLRRDATRSAAERTAASGHLFQPPAWSGPLYRIATAPFLWVQLPFRHTEWASGWLAVARRPQLTGDSPRGCPRSC